MHIIILLDNPVSTFCQHYTGTNGVQVIANMIYNTHDSNRFCHTNFES